jgi:hypothetical protein
MGSKDGIALYNKNAALWGMSIFYESVNVVYGYMKKSAYDFLNGKELTRPDKYIYMPEDELLRRGPLISFESTLQECLSNPPARTPWLQKLKYQRLLQAQKDLDPSLWSRSTDIHMRRKQIVYRWFESLVPYLDNYPLACSSFFPGTIESTVAKLKDSANLIVLRDNELGNNDFNDLAEHLSQYRT